MGRTLGWFALIALLGLAALFVALDVMDYAAGNAWKMAPLGQRWFEFHKDSLLLIQPAIERHVAVWLWPPFQWVLERPAWLVPALGGAFIALYKIVRRR